MYVRDIKNQNYQSILYIILCNILYHIIVQGDDDSFMDGEMADQHESVATSVTVK